jgi:hypothetical protein
VVLGSTVINFSYRPNQDKNKEFLRTLITQ